MKKQTKTEQIREYYRQMSRATSAQVADALGFTRGSTYKCVRELLDRGWLVKTDMRGLYEFHEIPEHEHGKIIDLQKKMWRAMRLSRAFTAWDIAWYSTATLDYAQKYVTFVSKTGHITRAGKDGHKIIWNVSRVNIPGKAPLMRLGKVKSEREVRRQEMMEAGWAMMRAIRDGDTATVKDKAGTILNFE